MKTKIISLLVLIAFAVVSCQKDEADKPVLKQDVEFGITQVDPNMLKNDWDFECDFDLVATVAHIEIEFEDETTQTFTPQIFFLNGNLYTQAIQLPTGTYTITKFLLLTEVGGQIVMATPKAGATYAGYVAKPVEFDITVGEFTKVEVEVEVLCFTPNAANDFGFFWFVIDEIIVREQCFFGDLCIKSKTDYLGSYYDALFDLDAYPFDLPAIFKVKLVRNDGWEKEWMNVELDENGDLVPNSFQAPLCIKYPDRVGVEDIFDATLYVYVAQGNGWEFVEFKTWQFTNFYIDEFVTQGEVIDFVVGYCNYNPNEDWVFPAWLNLPNTATIQITQNWDYLYWKLNVTGVVPTATDYDILNVGEWTSFCGDGETTLSNGTYNFYIYNTLYYDKWNDMPNTTEEAMNQVHWLINNIGNFPGYQAFQGIHIQPNTLQTTEAKILQDAIWNIINGPLGNVPWSFDPNSMDPNIMNNVALAVDMATTAQTNGSNFQPMPGQWSSVLVIRDDNPAQHQLIFTVVDP